MYYLRSLGASQVEKSTLDAEKYGFTQKRSNEKFVAAEPRVAVVEDAAPVLAGVADLDVDVKSCSLENPDCESCQ